jgi:hypothetical protein
VANTSGGRNRDERAAKGKGKATAEGKSAAPQRGARADGALKRGGTRRDAAALPLLGPDDDRPYPKMGAGRTNERSGRPKRPLGDRAQSGVRAPVAGATRAAGGGTRDRNRTEPREKARRGGARGARTPRDDGEVTGPFRRKREPVAKRTEGGRPVLRVSRGKRAVTEDRGEKHPRTAPARARTTSRSADGRGAARTAATTAPAKGDGAPSRRRRRPTEATEELRHLAGGNAKRALDTLERASEAFARGRERDALRMLRPLIDAYPRAAAVRELAGLCKYRIGWYAAAADDLTAFVDLSGSTEQHPVLMDCRRAQGRLRDVEELWEELRETSPTAALVTEGRIVVAGALADAGRLADAIDLLARRAQVSGRTQEHTVRLWYALADLEERAGDVPRARALFEQVRNFDAGYADVAERLAALT